MAQPASSDTIFCAAIEIADERERTAYLAHACGEDQELRARVEKLVAAHFRAGSFLEQPAASPRDTGAFDAASLLSSQAPTAGPEGQSTIIGPYKLLQLLGEGGMGAVFMAEQAQPVQRKVALKVIKSGLDSRQVLARFEAERQALALMDHPNIARVLDAGTTDTGRPYFVMELVKGVPITRYCDEHRLTPRQRLELFVPVCQAVQHAHQKGIIHRDLKPSNVLVTQYDGRPVPKVIDFGVAKAAGQQLTERTLFTELGQVVGTLEYMSPEQAELNQLDVDTRSDIYSLGVLLYELLTGTTPLERNRLKEAAFLEILRLIREEEPPRPSTRLSTTEQLPSIAANRGLEPRKLSGLMRGELDWIVLKALEKDRNRRYESPNGLARDIERYLNDEAVQACPPSAWYRFKKFARRKKLTLMVAGLVLGFVVLLGGGVGWVMRDKAARQAQTRADIETALRGAQVLQDQQKWPEALAVVKQAQALLASGGGDQELRRRVNERVDDLELLVELDGARLRWTNVKKDALNYQESDAAFAQAFRKHGVDVESLDPQQAAALLRTRSISTELAGALDAWAEVLRLQKKEGWKDRLAVARAIDPDAFRERVREAVSSEDSKAMEEVAAADQSADLPAPTLLLLAYGLMGPNAPDRAAVLLKKAQHRQPGDFWIYYGLFEASYKMKPVPLDEAIRYMTAATALRPLSPVAHDNLGAVLRMRGRLEESIAEHREAIRLGNNALSHVALALALSQSGHLEEAVPEYREALRLKPDYFDAHLNFGVALRRLNRLDEAIEENHAALRLNANDADAHHNLGNVLHARGKPGDLDEAIKQQREAVRLAPDDIDAHISLGNALMENHQLDEAIDQFKAAIHLDPRISQAHTNLGACYLKKGQLDDAITECRLAARLDLRSASPRANLGLALAGKGQTREAIVVLNDVVRRAPNLVGISNFLAWLLVTAADSTVWDPARAAELATKIIQQAPTFAPGWRTLGVAQYRAGDWNAAMTALEKSVALSMGGDGHDWYFLAMAQHRLGNGKAAREWYDRAVQWHEKNQPKDEELGRFRAEAGKLLELKK